MKGPNDKYYRKKADELFMRQFRGRPCEVCNKSEGTCGHHIVNKARSKALRYDKRNIVVLCQSHHKFSNDLAPHSSNQMAVERFINWFKEKHPDRHKWITENERTERRYTYKQAFENLKAGDLGWK